LNSLKQTGVISNIDLALNLETYDKENISRQFENNTIILYVYGKKPEIFKEVASAIKNAKTLRPDIWKLSPRELAKSKESIIKDFMIPLDENVSFAEMSNTGSYHANVTGKAFYEITGDFAFKPNSLDEFIKKIEPYSPGRPGLIDDLPERRKYMPALLFK
jgi:hypothetical protein